MQAIRNASWHYGTEGCDDLQHAFRHWPAYTDDAKKLQASLDEMKGASQALESELARATEWTKLAAKRQQLQSALKLQGQLQEKIAASQGIKRVAAEQVRTLEDALRRKQIIETKLGAGKLRLTLETVQNIPIVYQSDLRSPTEQFLTPDVPLAIEAGGRIVLEHSDWKLTVTSGDTSFDELQSEFQIVEGEIQLVLADADVSSIDELREAGRIYAETESSIAESRRDLGKVLGGVTIEELGKTVGASSGEAPPREILQITDEKLALGKDILEAEAKLKNLNTQLIAWSRDYQSVDQVMDRLAPLHLRVRKLTEEIDALPVPSDAALDIERLQIVFTENETRLRIIKEEDLPETKEKLARLQGDEPDSSVAELIEQFATAQIAFGEAQKRAQAFQTIQSVFADLKAALDQKPLGPLLEDVERSLHQLTGDRFDQINLEEGTFRRCDSVTMPTHLLSVGMNAGFGLAVRLAMASHFLSGQDGLLVLDDPFVDVDPERQKAAADLISSFARDKQVLVLTCHPSQAALFGVVPIELGRLN